MSQARYLMAQYFPRARTVCLSLWRYLFRKACAGCTCLFCWLAYCSLLCSALLLVAKPVYNLWPEVSAVGV
jgi:hypothetical protein